MALVRSRDRACSTQHCNDSYDSVGRTLHTAITPLPMQSHLRPCLPAAVQCAAAQPGLQVAALTCPAAAGICIIAVPHAARERDVAPAAALPHQLMPALPGLPELTPNLLFGQARTKEQVSEPSSHGLEAAMSLWALVSQRCTIAGSQILMTGGPLVSCSHCTALPLQAAATMCLLARSAHGLWPK